MLFINETFLVYKLEKFKNCKEQLRGELHKSEVFLIDSTLLVVKPKNISMHKTMETELSHQTAFRNSVPCHKDVH